MGKGQTIDSFFGKKRPDAEANEQGNSEPITVQPPLLLLEFGKQNYEEKIHQTQTNEAIFCGIESLVRDPALCPQIWQYPANQRDDVRSAYLKLGPMQPLLNNYKTYGTESQKRRFKYNWFSLSPAWLEYSESSHRAYCLFCFLFGRNKSKRGDSDVFAVHGFANWKKVNDGRKCAFLNHIGSEPCSEHNNATMACQDLINHCSGRQQEGYRKKSVKGKSFNLIDRLLRLLVTLPVSTASAERAFYSLKIIKTRLRNKMEDEFLANSLLVNIKREIAEKYDYEDILLHFTDAKRRRADM